MRRSTKFYRKNEEEVMLQLGFNPTVNSGAGWIQKEDGENDLCLCQLKSTDNDSISVKQRDLDILIANATTSHKIPIFAINFLSSGQTYVLVKPEDIMDAAKVIKGIEVVRQESIVEHVESAIKKNSIKSSVNARERYIEKNKYRKKENKA